MAEIRWTIHAADELEAITELIARDSPHFAELFAIKVLEAVERLGEFPAMGHIVPEIGDSSIRETHAGSYRVIYRFNDNVVHVLTLYHTARLLDPTRLFED